MQTNFIYHRVFIYGSVILKMGRKLDVILMTLLILSLVLLSGCNFFRERSRLSGAVMFIYSQGSVQEWLEHPKKSYVQAYFYFPPDLGSDIIFGVDQEMLEGVDNPIHFPGADWMALVGLTREGVLWIPIGTEDALNGTPSDASVWDVIDLDVILQPNTWYFMRETADFQTRRFESFSLKGPNVNITVDLSDYNVDYPNYIPLDNRMLTYYVYAIRVNDNVGCTNVYFDDVEAGIETANGFETIMRDGFETQQKIPDIPVVLPVTHVSNLREYYWYKENEKALLRIVNTVSHSGSFSCLCNVTLKRVVNNLGKNIVINRFFAHALSQV